MEILNQIIISVFSSTAFLIIVFPFLEKWLFVRLEKSIQYKYDKQFEDYKFSRLKRQKAELIAALFSKWIKYYGRETILLKKVELRNYYEELNRMSMELCIWLDDEKLLNDIMTRLQNLETAKDPRILLADVRKLVLENKKDIFKSEDIVLWPPPGNIESIYGPRPE